MPSPSVADGPCKLDIIRDHHDRRYTLGKKISFFPKARCREVCTSGLVLGNIEKD